MTDHTNGRYLWLHGAAPNSYRPFVFSLLLLFIQIRDDHQRSNSGADMISLAELRQLARQRDTADVDSDAGDDLEYDVDAAKESTPTREKRLQVNTTSESDDDDSRPSPTEVEESAQSTPADTSEDQRSDDNNGGRLLIIANRLPFSMKMTKKTGEDGKETNDVSIEAITERVRLSRPRICTLADLCSCYFLHVFVFPDHFHEQLRWSCFRFERLSNGQSLDRLARW